MAVVTVRMLQSALGDHWARGLHTLPRRHPQFVLGTEVGDLRMADTGVLTPVYTAR